MAPAASGGAGLCCFLLSPPWIESETTNMVKRIAKMISSCNCMENPIVHASQIGPNERNSEPLVSCVSYIKINPAGA